MTRNNLILLHLFGLIALLLVALALASCRTQDHFVDVNNMVYQNRVDSVYLYTHDSIYIDRWQAGDTVYITKTVESVKFKDKIVLQRDTSYITKTETQTVIQQKVPKWCWWCLGILILLFLLFIVRLLYRFRV